MPAPSFSIPPTCGLPLPPYLQAVGAALDGVATPKGIMHGILMSIVAVVLFSIFAAFARWVGKTLKIKLTKLVMAKLPRIASKRLSLFKSVSTWLGVLINAAYFIVAAAALYVCVIYVLSLFDYTRLWSKTLESGIGGLMLDLGKTTLHSIPGIFAVAVIAFLAKGLSYLIDILFGAIERGEATLPWIHQDTAAPTRRIATALLWIFTIVVAYPYIPGNESVAFKSISVFVGLLVSLGSAGVVSQAMNGLAITFGRSFKPGDYVKIGDVEGTVSEVTLVFTKLRTIKSEEIIVPNSIVASQITYNYTRMADGHGVGISTSIGVGYDVPWRQVHALLVMAAENTKGLSRDPAPYIVQAALSGTGAEYTLVVHSTEEPKLAQFVKSELHQNIQDAFSKYGLQLVTPTYIETRVPGAVPVERWYAAPAKGGE